MIRMDDFLNSFQNEVADPLVKFATVAPGHTTGRARLVFDGESVPTVKAYPYLGSYTPVAGHRVMVMHGVIMGDIK